MASNLRRTRASLERVVEVLRKEVAGKKPVPVHRTIHYNSINIQATLIHQGRFRIAMQL